MELIERPNLRHIHYLNSISYEDFSQSCIQDADKNGEKKPKKTDIQIWYSVLRKYLQSVIKTKGNTKRIYTYSLKSSAEIGGRLFCGNSLQGIWGVYRGLLMRDIATDIDMVNAHPVILRYVCKKHNIDCPYLEYYINNREHCFGEFSSRSVAKKTYLKAINNEKLNRDTKLPENFKRFDKEMKVIQKKITELKDYADLVNTVPETKQYNFNGSAINRVLCYYENIILSHAIHFINICGIEIAVLMFDGLMVYGNYYDDHNLLNELSKYVAEQIPDLNMKWTYKEHDDSMVVPDDFDESNYDSNNGIRFATDDNHARDLIMDDLKGKLVYDAIAKRVFYYKEPIWISDALEIEKTLTNYILTSGICRANEDNKYIPYSQNIHSAESIRKTIMTRIIDEPPVNVSELFHSTTVGRVAFEDGVLDFNKKRFYKWDEIDFPYYTAVYNPMTFYGSTPDRQLIDEIREKVFRPLYGDKLDDALNFFARGIAGYSCDKKWMMYIGSRDCGKSTTNEAFSSAFGTQYVKPLSIMSMMYQRNRQTEEDSRSFYWALELEFARLAISQEIPTPSEHLRMKGAMWKKLTSGIDTLTARRNYDRTDTHFKHQCTFALVGNNSVEIDTPDAWETCFQVSSAIRFKSQEEIDALRSNDTDERIMSFYRVSDPTLIDNFKHNIKWKHAIIWLLLESFKDKAVNTTRPPEDTDTQDVMETIFEHYDITKSVDDVVLVSDLHTVITGDKKKIASQLEHLGVPKKRCKDRTSAYRDKVVYIGIRIK